MEVKAQLNNLRISPRKVRLAADLIRGLGVRQARVQLNFLTKRPALPLLKLLNSAAANAKQNFKLNPDEMYVAKITVDGGPVLKRIMPRAMGRAFQIRKRTSHVAITLAEKKDKNLPPVSKKVTTKKMPKEIKKDDPKASGQPAAVPVDKDKNVRAKTKSAAVKRAARSGGKRLTGLARRAFNSK